MAATSTILDHTPTAHPPTFHFSPFLRDTYQVGLSPSRPACKAFQTGHCPRGTRCPERHVLLAPDGNNTSNGNKYNHHGGGGLNSLVCKHWLRGLCKKGEGCEFLHEYNLRKMPECNFFMRNGYCSNGEECLYLHIDPLSRLPPCPHYEMGFCPLGPQCSKKHVRRKLCVFYLAGFCPEGGGVPGGCPHGAHPKWRENLDKPSTKKEERGRVEEEQAARMAEGMREEEEGRERGDRDGGGRGFGRGRGKWRGGRGKWRGRGH